MRQLCTALPALLLGATAHAHEGHGLLGSHWHTSDVVGFVVFGVLAVMVIWHLRK